MSRELKRFTTFVWELSVIWNNEIKATKILIVINNADDDNDGEF